MVEIHRIKFSSRFMSPQELLEQEDGDDQQPESDTFEDDNVQLTDQDFSEDVVPEHYFMANQDNRYQEEVDNILRVISASLNKYIEECINDRLYGQPISCDQVQIPEAGDMPSTAIMLNVPHRYPLANINIQDEGLKNILQVVTTSTTKYIEDCIEEYIRNQSNGSSSGSSEQMQMVDTVPNIPADVCGLVELPIKINELLKEQETLRQLTEGLMRLLNFYNFLIGIVVMKMIFVFLLLLNVIRC